MTSENTPQQPEHQPTPRYTPAPSFTGRSSGVSARPQTAERLDSLKSTAQAAGQKINDFRTNPRAGRDTAEATARTAWNRTRVWGEKGLRTLSSGALKAADYLKSLEKDVAPGPKAPGELPSAGTTPKR
ncbi:hypothetical protein AB0E44_06630 [Micrococcus terreus]|uniref:hypothetical protein n=1 Tax=Micrococcus terreus TaxID=574650 RepID=UPI0033CFECF6